MKHLYVHTPFCRSRCAYCDFASEPVGPHDRAGRVGRYVEALLAELETRAASMSFETIYLGGGTPTVLPADLLVDLACELAARLVRAPGSGEPAPAGEARPALGAAEFTVEANPGTMDVALLERLAAAGVTRLSLGVQSFAPALRAALGRRVTQREIGDALAAVTVAGWQEWNLDLMFGIPGQSWDGAVADLDAAIAAAPTHISLYDLTYTPDFAARVKKTMGAGARRAAGAFAERHYAKAVSRLESAGYRRYEVSNFALPGHECRHNQAYWRGEDYLGIGASAVSTITAERRTNPRSVAGYLAAETPFVEALSSETRLYEKGMLGLRTAEGVEESLVLPVLDLEARERLLAQGCVERRYGKLRLNPGFLDVSNAVIGALLVHPGG